MKKGFTIAELYRLRITKKLNPLQDVIHAPALSPLVCVDWKGYGFYNYQTARYDEERN